MPDPDPQGSPSDPVAPLSALTEYAAPTDPIAVDVASTPQNAVTNDPTPVTPYRLEQAVVVSVVPQPSPVVSVQAVTAYSNSWAWSRPSLTSRML